MISRILPMRSGVKIVPSFTTTPIAASEELPKTFENLSAAWM